MLITLALNLSNGIMKINNMKNNLKVGIVGWKVGDNSFGCTVPYLSFIQENLGIPYILGPRSLINKGLDLVILPGGSDIDSSRYDTAPGFNISKPDPYKEYFDVHILPRYIELGIPVFGICRGFQALAVHFGNPLEQDMYHETNDDISRWNKVHSLKLNPIIQEEITRIYPDQYYTLLKRKSYYDEQNLTTNKNLYEVNSMHHQAVYETDKLKEDFDIMAWYNGPYAGYYKAVEAFIHKEKPISGVQYHPEELGYDELTLFLIDQMFAKKSNGEPAPSKKLVEHNT